MKLASTVLTILALAMTVGAQKSGDFQTPAPGMTITLHGDGTVTTIPLYTGPPIPEWVPDPSAGHYDCPDGWTAMESVEPEKYYGLTMGGWAYIEPHPTLDKKGHKLKSQPAPPICIKDKP